MYLQSELSFEGLVAKEEEKRGVVVVPRGGHIKFRHDRNVRFRRDLQHCSLRCTRRQRCWRWGHHPRRNAAHAIVTTPSWQNSDEQLLCPPRQEEVKGFAASTSDASVASVAVVIV